MRTIQRGLLFGLMLASVTGCGPAATFVPTNTVFVERPSRPIHEVEVVTGGRPLREYVELGLIAVRETSGLAQIILDLRTQAAQRGCDGVIVHELPPLFSHGQSCCPPGENSIVSAKCSSTSRTAYGTCVVWTPTPET